MTDRAGGCACGAIRFNITAPFLGIGTCHCTDCQKASGGGPNFVALTPAPALELTQGEPKVFHKRGDSGAEVGRAFCGDCGTPLWSVPAHETFLPVKLGALDDNADLALNMQIYAGSAPAWHCLHDGVATFEKMPPAPPE